MQNKLTSREQEIFDLLIKGLSPKEIAFNLNIKYATVDFHRNSLYRKLDVQSIQELIVKYGKTEPKTEQPNSAEPEKSPIPSISEKKKYLVPALIIALVVSFALNMFLFFLLYFSGK